LASQAFMSNRSPDRGRKAIYSEVTATEARFAAFARSSYAGSRRFFVQETGLRNGAFGADKFGLRKLKQVHWNLGAPQLYQ